MRYRLLNTFTGPFVLLLHDDGRLGTSWLNAEVRMILTQSREDRALLPDLSRRLAAYFDGQRVDFTDIKTPHASDFYERCWTSCRAIKRGQTRTYAELAESAGSTASAARAAGQAMRNNPLPIIIPCHRIIGSNGRLHGFGGSCDASGAELGVKAALLRMEGALNNSQPPAAPPRRRQQVLVAAE